MLSKVLNLLRPVVTHHRALCDSLGFCSTDSEQMYVVQSQGFSAEVLRVGYFIRKEVVFLFLMPKINLPFGVA